MADKSMGQMRGAAVLEAFLRVMAREKDKNVTEVLAIAAKEPAPIFFVDYPRAQRMVSELERKGRKSRNPYKAAMFEELHRRWKARGARRYVALGEIIEQPAPSFYMSLDNFKAIVYKRLKYEKENRRNKKENK